MWISSFQHPLILRTFWFSRLFGCASQSALRLLAARLTTNDPLFDWVPAQTSHSSQTSYPILHISLSIAARSCKIDNLRHSYNPDDAERMSLVNLESIFTSRLTRVFFIVFLTLVLIKGIRPNRCAMNSSGSADVFWRKKTWSMAVGMRRVRVVILVFLRNFNLPTVSTSACMALRRLFAYL